MGKIPSNLGIVIPGFSGVYDSNRQYEFYEFIRDNGDTYVSKKPSKGISTSNEEYWFRITDMYGFAQGTITGSTGVISQIIIPDFYAGVPLDVTAKFVAKQEGTGDPSPENVRPIVGKSVINVWRGGKNLVDYANDQYVNASATRTLITNGIRITSTAPGSNVSSALILPLVLLGQTVTLQYDMAKMGNNSGVNARFITMMGGNVITTIATTANDVARGILTVKMPDVLPPTANRIAIRFYANYNNASSVIGDYAEFTNIQLELGSTATAYEPYAGNTYPVMLPEAVYGMAEAVDEVDLACGIVTMLTKYTELQNITSFNMSATQPSDTRYAAWYIPAYELNRMNIKGICSHVPWHINPIASLNGENIGIQNTNGNMFISLMKSRFTGWNDSWTNTEKTSAFRDWLAVQHAAGKPLQVLYELATPQTLAINPFIFPALSGLNNVYTDGSDEISTSLSYFIHQTNTMQDMWNEIQLLKNAIAKF